MLFSGDFPHVEGKRKPLQRFGETFKGLPQTAFDYFYSENFTDLMGSELAPELLKPLKVVAV
jgi:hypothetical protein